jgi:hypothetical protein
LSDSSWRAQPQSGSFFQPQSWIKYKARQMDVEMKGAEPRLVTNCLPREAEGVFLRHGHFQRRATEGSPDPLPPASVGQQSVGQQSVGQQSVGQRGEPPARV